MKQHVFLVLYFFVVVKLDFPGGWEAWSKNQGNSRGLGGSYNHPVEWKFQGGGGYKIKKHSVGGVWIFSGTTH